MTTPKDVQSPPVSRSYLQLILLIVALLALRWTIVEPYVVPSGSMEPTLKVGDRLYALKCAYDIRVPFTDKILFRTRAVRRGDVFLFRFPENPSITFVKRVAGIPGDRVAIRNGVLYINSKPVKEAPAPESGNPMYDIEDSTDKALYIENLTGTRHYMILNHEFPQMRNMPEMVVPADNYFAMGDNRDNSLDSRAWGFVPFRNILGEAMFIWFSSEHSRIRWERIGTLIH